MLYLSFFPIITITMEDLNKTQLVMLTLLVSFVTSIATGIITVSLLQVAPPGVTQTINRVVEKTIERVVPAEGDTKNTKEVTTVVVKEEDLVIDAINKNAKSLVRIKDTALTDGVSQFYGIGFLYSKDGLVVSDRKENLSAATTYLGTFEDGTSFQMKAIAWDDNTGLAYFQIIKDQKTNLPANSAVLASKDLQLGQTVIGIEGQTKNVVAIGRVVSFDTDDTSEGKPVVEIETDIVVKTAVTGGPLVNLSGEVVGIRNTKTSSSPTNERYVPLSAIKSSIASFVKK